MSSFCNLSDSFFDRQLNVRNSSIYYNKKLLSSLFNYSLNLNEFKMNKYISNSLVNHEKLCFSKNGDYLSLGNYVFKMNDNYLSSELSLIMNLDDNDKVQTGIVFNKDCSKLIASGFYDNFSEKCITINDFSIGETINIVSLYSYAKTITNNPLNSNLIAYGCFDGSLYLNDFRSSKSKKLYQNSSETRSISFHPLKDYLILNISPCKNGFFTFDIRNCRPSFYYNVPNNNNFDYLYATYNNEGDKIFLTRLQSNAFLFFSNESYPVFEFDEIGYYNFLYKGFYGKNCCFAGINDEYVMSPSDDTNLYIWKIPKINNNEKNLKKVSSAKFVLRNKFNISSVGFNYKKLIVGCLGNGSNLKFWTPILYDSKSNLKFEENIENSNISKQNKEYIVVSFNLLEEFIENSFSNLDEKNYLNKNNICNENLNLDIINIKSFLDQYSTELKKEKTLFKKSKNILEKEITLKTFYEENLLSIIFELYKFFKKNIFMKKSILFLKRKILEINDLNKKKYLESMVIELEKIILKNENVYKIKFKMIKTFLYELYKLLWLPDRIDGITSYKINISNLNESNINGNLF